ncbi:PilZ domain-containing protein [Silvibacterium bohemicum]|uniref:PilZ domain-containing protein n=1 Tax=Silvibacterium bohemicum TaxID=1577686 RepID=UPI0009E35782
MNLVPVIERSLQRRAAVRYRLRLPVIFHWNDGADHTEGGFTVDVALDGAFILSSRCPRVGSEVRIEILLPSPDQSAEELRIECVGKVMRVVSEPGCSGFGVHGTFDDDHLTRQVHL